MVEKRALLAVLLATSLAGSATAASAAGSMTSRPIGTNAVVSGHIARSDSPLTALALVRARLIMAFRISHGVVMVDLDLPTTGNDYELDTIQDSGDGIDPLGAKNNGIRQDGLIPVTSNTPVH